MIIMIVSMFLKVRTQKKTVAPQHPNADRSAARNIRLHNQMFILMLSSVGVFFVTTLPLVVYDSVLPYTITDIAGIQELLSTRTIFTWLQTLNCAVSFIFFLSMKTNMINHRLIFMSTVLLRISFVKNFYN
jgi:hypothetical protein